MNLVFLGPPGVGKGTQAKRLASRLKIPHVSSGELFRSIITQGTPLGDKLATYLNRGVYVPDELAVDVIRERLSEPDSGRGFILDGFPRTVAQAEALDRWLEGRGRRIDLVLNVTAPTAVLFDRIANRLSLEHRTDDLPSTIQTRLDTYERETKPVIDYYRQMGKLAEIDGSRMVTDVGCDIDAAVSKSVAPS